MLKYHCREVIVPNTFGTPSLVDEFRFMDLLFAFGNDGANRLLRDAHEFSTWEVTDFRRNIKVKVPTTYTYSHFEKLQNSPFLSVRRSVCLAVYLSVCLSPCLCSYLSDCLCLSVCLSVSLCAYLSEYLSICSSDYLSDQLPPFWSVCLMYIDTHFWVFLAWNGLWTLSILIIYKKRGLANRNLLPYFPYRDDGMRILTVIERMVERYVDLWVKS